MNPKRLLTVAEVAKIVERPRQSVGRLLKRLHNRLVAAGQPGILTTAPGWNGSKKQYLVSVGSLQEHFPLWLENSGYVPEVVEKLSDEMKDMRKSVNGRFRDVSARMSQMRDALDEATRALEWLLEEKAKREAEAAAKEKAS